MVVLFSVPSLSAQTTRILFDAAHAQTAGNADWVLDEDSCGIAQRYPTPDQSLITSTTSETFWSGALSAFGVDIVKKGFAVESLPAGNSLTYGNTANPQDLANYQVLVSCEPNTRFSATEIAAIRSFVQNGGGLLLIADHAGSDRNNDGYDSPVIWNEVMGAPSLFGFSFLTNSADPNAWFDDNPDDNYTRDTTSPIIFTGPYGIPSAGRGLGLFGSDTMNLDLTANASVKGHVWKRGAVADTSTTLVTMATATYGSGRVAALPDSSTAEDATNGCSHTTYTGYNDTRFDNGIIIANAVAWVAKKSGGTPPPPPATPSGLVATGGSMQVTLSWTASTGATSYNVKRAGVTGGPYTTIATAVANPSYTDGSVAAGTTYFYVVSAVNGGGESANSNEAFATPTGDTLAPSAPTNLTATAAKRKISLSWTASTDNVAVSGYQIWRSTSASGPFTQIATTTSTTFANGSITSGTTLYYFVRAYDAAGNVSLASSTVNATAK